MADETQSGSAPQPGAAAAAAPMLNIIGQYIKDLSFENPKAPQSILAAGGQPKFNVTINVGVNKQADDVYAIELTFNAKAERETNVLFNIELIYGGLFRLKNWPEAQMGPVLMIECPRILFPFARQVLATTTQAGGFPPLLMDPVDFAAIYRQNLAALQAQQKAAMPGSDPGKPN
jgi:preprotein translocase subunit SecB